MTFESNYAITIAALCDKLKNKITCQFCNQWEANQEPFAQCKRDFSRALRKLQVIAWNSD